MPSVEEEKEVMGNGHDLTAALSESHRARMEAERLVEAIRRARVEWQSLLRQRCRQQPYATLAVAVGVGYVVGGGLAPGLIRSLAGAGSRLALGMLMQRLLAVPTMDSNQFETE